MSSTSQLLALACEMWNTVRESIVSIDRDSVAESVVALLIDHDCSPAQIRSAFRGDADIIEALKLHVDSDVVSEDDGEIDDDDDLDYSFDDHDDDDDEDW